MTDAPNYNDGLWHGWNGGECPVAKGPWSCSRRGRCCLGPQDATEDVYWPNVIVFRVVKPALRSPRTIYLCEFRDGERSSTQPQSTRPKPLSPTATARPSQSGRKSCERTEMDQGLGMSALRMTIGAAIPSSKPWMMCFSTCAQPGPSWQMANASLIAAAPDMAEALKAAIAISDRNVGTADALMNASMSMTNVLPPLAKARGEA